MRIINLKPLDPDQVEGMKVLCTFPEGAGRITRMEAVGDMLYVETENGHFYEVTSAGNFVGVKA